MEEKMARILIVEDDPFLTRAYLEVLKKAGHYVESAADGYLGLRMVEEKAFDVVLLDLIMPDMDGLGFLRHLNFGLETPLVIVFTNVSDANMEKEVMALGAWRYLTKAAVSPKELMAIIEEAVIAKAEDDAAGPKGGEASSDSMVQ
jgi:DNA-binding response OmpR family regulator